MKKIKVVAMLAGIVFGMSSFSLNTAYDLEGNGCDENAMVATLQDEPPTFAEFLETYTWFYETCDKAVKESVRIIEH